MANPLQPPMSYGFMDGSQYDINGKQLQAPPGAGFGMPPAPMVGSPSPTPAATPAQPGSMAMPVSTAAPTMIPAAPAATPAMPDISGLEKQYQQNLLPTTDENQTQTQLDNLIASRDMGINNVKAEPIPMDIIRGFSQNILENANTQQQTLQQRLSTLQAKRQASLEASKFALSRADQQAAALKDQSKPTEVGPGNSLVRLNPTTGQYENAYTAPQDQNKLLTEANNFTNDNNITSRFFQYPGNPTVYDSRTLEPLSYDEYKARGGTGNPGAAFPDVQTIQPKQTDKLLTPTEAARLGVPYGTTQQEAAAASITPAFGKTSSGTSKSSSKPSGKVTSTQLADAFKTGWAKEGYIQGNGKISSKDYKEAKAEWRKQGFTGAAFDNAMSDLIDKSSKNWKTDYGYGS